MSENNGPSVPERRGLSIYQEMGQKYLTWFKNLEQQLKIGEKVENISIRHHQLECVLRAREMLEMDRVREEAQGGSAGNYSRRKVNPVVIVAPTGAGKSGMIVLLPYVLEAKKCLVLTPSKTITQQLSKSFGVNKNDKSFFEKALGMKPMEARGALEPGLISVIKESSDIEKVGSNLVIVNAQRFGGKSNASLTLVQGKKDIVKNVKQFFAQFDVLLVDEAHHYPAETWKKIINAFNANPVEGLRKKIVFLTATPYRNGPGGRQVPILDNLGDRIAHQVYVKELEGRFIRKIEFVEKQDHNCNLLENIKAIFQEQEQNEPRFTPQALVIVNNIQTAKTVASLLNKKEGRDDFAIALYTSGNNPANAIGDIDKFTTGDFRVAIVCDLLNEGYDNPNVVLCVILRNIGSQLLFSQFIGRCRRMNHSLETKEGEELDRTTGKVLSYVEFKQRKLWEGRDKLPETSPTEDENGEDVQISSWRGLHRVQLALAVRSHDDNSDEVEGDFIEVEIPEMKPDIRELVLEFGNSVAAAASVAVNESRKRASGTDRTKGEDEEGEGDSVIAPKRPRPGKPRKKKALRIIHG